MVRAISIEIEIAVYYVYWYLAENVDYAIFFSPSFTAMRWWSVYGSGLLTVLRFVRGLMMRSSVSPRVWVGALIYWLKPFSSWKRLNTTVFPVWLKSPSKTKLDRFLACVCKLWEILGNLEVYSSQLHWMFVNENVMLCRVFLYTWCVQSTFSTKIRFSCVLVKLLSQTVAEYEQNLLKHKQFNGQLYRFLRRYGHQGQGHIFIYQGKMTNIVAIK